MNYGNGGWLTSKRVKGLIVLIKCDGLSWVLPRLNDFNQLKERKKRKEKCGSKKYYDKYSRKTNFRQKGKSTSEKKSNLSRAYIERGRGRQCEKGGE